MHDHIKPIERSVAVVTGASSGLGAIYAHRLADRGYSVVLVARRGAVLQRLAADIAARTQRTAEILVADLTSERDLMTLESRLRDDPRVDVLVNNAGIAMSGPLVDSDLTRLETMIRLNILAPTRLAMAVATSFVARRRGTIIMLASATAVAFEWVHGAYAGTKAYVLTLSRKLQQEFAGTGVRVQVVLPGAVQTEMWESAGTSLKALSPDRVMDAGTLVDAALAGLDRGEDVTIPSLPDIADWNAYESVRQTLLPNLSHRAPAPRYATEAQSRHFDIGARS